MTEKRASKDWIKNVYEVVANDEELSIVLLAIEEGMPPREIADDLGLAREEVYVLLRKLKRRIKAANLEPRLTADRRE